ncbi:DUF4296 domain-containing protein [Phocaeicola sp.]
MRKKNRWTLLLGAALLVGCGKQVPKSVIQPGQMESILYDYHLSTSMSANISYSENYKKEALRQYVFQKHRITEAEFDSSMVWYTRHTAELARIYTNLGKRFREEKKAMSKLLAARENRPEISLPGDTVNIWYNKALYWLTDAPLTNKVSFAIPTDSNFKAKDAFLWSADYTFLSDEQQRVTMGFNVLFDNDSVVGRVKEITGSGVQTLYIKTDSAYNIRSINGFIYLSGDSVEAPGVIVNNITLTRYHAPVDTTALAQEAAKDSVAVKKEEGKAVVTAPAVKKEEVDSAANTTVPVRLTPREMKEKDMKDGGDTIRPQRIRPRRTNN